LEEATEEAEEAEDVCSEEPDLTGGVEGVDYMIAYEEVPEEAED
jgi:hypothetical protein